jgi:hypothetical protein
MPGPIDQASLRRHSVARCAAENLVEGRPRSFNQLVEFMNVEHTKESLTVPQVSLTPSRFNVRHHAAGRVEEPVALFEAQGRLPKHQVEWLEWLIGLPPAELIDPIARCSALAENALPSSGAVAGADAIGAALAVDMTDSWEPPGRGSLKHVPKPQIVLALKEGGGVEAVKKDALVTAAASRVAGARALPENLPQPLGCPDRAGGRNSPARSGSEESCGW